VREQAADRLVLDVTGALSVIAVTGPEAGTVLRRITHIHRFPSGGEVAHVTAHVLERGGGYWIVVAQELGEHMADVVLDRAEALGGGLVGVDALGAGS
jgi:glycine cleavage system aminomethyltransferase T